MRKQVSLTGFAACMLAVLRVYAEPGTQEKLQPIVQAAVALTIVEPISVTETATFRGSGMFIHNPGKPPLKECAEFVLTNAHVISDVYMDGTMKGSINAEWRTFKGGIATGTHTEKATVVFADKYVDLALIRLMRPDCEQTIRPVRLLAPEHVLGVPDDVWYVSAVEGKVEGLTLCKGNVSRHEIGDDGQESLGISCPVKGGQSGGGVFKYNPDTTRFELGACTRQTTVEHEYVNYGIPVHLIATFLEEAFGEVK